MKLLALLLLSISASAQQFGGGGAGGGAGGVAGQAITPASVVATTLAGNGAGINGLWNNARHYTVALNGGDYTTLNAAIAGIAPGLTPGTSVVLDVKVGTSQETPVAVPGFFAINCQRQTTLLYNSASAGITLTGSGMIYGCAINNVGGPGLDVETSSNVFLVEGSVTGASGYAVRVSSPILTMRNFSGTATTGHALDVTGNMAMISIGGTWATNGSGNAIHQTGTGGFGIWFDAAFNGTTGSPAIMLHGATSSPRFQNVAICAKLGQNVIDADSQMTGNFTVALIGASYTNACTGGGGLSKSFGSNVQFFSNSMLTAGVWSPASLPTTSGQALVTASTGTTIYTSSPTFSGSMTAANNVTAGSSVTASGFFGNSISVNGGANQWYRCTGSSAGTFDGNLASGNSNAGACAGGTWTAVSFKGD